MTERILCCFNILEQGPCSEDKWFVLSNTTFPVNGLPLGLCDQNPCNNSELFVFYNNSCELEFTQGPCGKNMELRLNEYGNGKVTFLAFLLIFELKIIHKQCEQ